MKWTRCEQKGTIIFAIATAILDSTVILCYVIFVLFCFVLFGLKRVTSCCWIIYFLIWFLCGISNVICNVIWLPMHYKYTLHSTSHSLCVNNFYCKKEPINLHTVIFSNKIKKKVKVLLPHYRIPINLTRGGFEWIKEKGGCSVLFCFVLIEKDELVIEYPQHNYYIHSTFHHEWITLLQERKKPHNWVTW